MKPELENLKEYTDKLSLSSEEKFNMLQNLRTYADTRPVSSPFAFNIFAKQSFAYASIFALLIGTGATSFAAESSLPGDILYTIKTDINEEVVRTFSFTDAQKAKVAINRIDKRMGELEKMVVLNTDSPEKIDMVVAKLAEHKSDLQDYGDQVHLADSGEVQEATEIYATLDSVLDAHIDILEEIQEDSQGQVATSASPDTVVTARIAQEDQDQKVTEDSTVVLTMMATPEDSPLPQASTLSDEATSSVPTDFVIDGEEDAITEAVNFSAQMESLITSIPSPQDIDSKISKHRTDTRKKIIEFAEDELNIEIEEETQIQIKTLIK